MWYKEARLLIKKIREIITGNEMLLMPLQFKVVKLSAAPTPYRVALVEINIPEMIGRGKDEGNNTVASAYTLPIGSNAKAIAKPLEAG